MDGRLFKKSVERRSSIGRTTLTILQISKWLNCQIAIFPISVFSIYHFISVPSLIAIL